MECECLKATASKVRGASIVWIPGGTSQEFIIYLCGNKIWVSAFLWEQQAYIGNCLLLGHPHRPANSNYDASPQYNPKLSPVATSQCIHSPSFLPPPASHHHHRRSIIPSISSYKRFGWILVDSGGLETLRDHLVRTTWGWFASSLYCHQLVATQCIGDIIHTKKRSIIESGSRFVVILGLSFNLQDINVVVMDIFIREGIGFRVLG